MYEQQVKFKPNSLQSRFAKPWISPAVDESSINCSLVFGFRLGTSVLPCNVLANDVENSMLIGRALSAASCRSSAVIEFLLILTFSPRFSFLG